MYFLCILICVAVFSNVFTQAFDFGALKQQAFDKAISKTLSQAFNFGMEHQTSVKPDDFVIQSVTKFMKQHPLKLTFLTQQIFRILDVNGDGLLTHNELHCDLGLATPFLDAFASQGIFQDKLSARPGLELLLCAGNKLHRKYANQEDDVLSDVLLMLDADNDKIIDSNDLATLALDLFEYATLVLKQTLKFDTSFGDNARQFILTMPEDVTKSMFTEEALQANEMILSQVAQFGVDISSDLITIENAFFDYFDYNKDGKVDKNDLTNAYNTFVYSDTGLNLAILRQLFVPLLDKIFDAKANILGGSKSLKLSDLAPFKAMAQQLAAEAVTGQFGAPKTLQSVASLETNFNDVAKLVNSQ